MNVLYCILLGFVLRRNQYFLMALQQLKEVRCVAMLGAPILTSLAVIEREVFHGYMRLDLCEDVEYWASLIWDS